MYEELYELLDIIYDSSLGFTKDEIQSMLEINSFDLDLYLKYLLDRRIIKLDNELYIPIMEYDSAIELIAKGA
jgi:ribonucleotide reductase beta subunit family protein with ferritin-like domain